MKKVFITFLFATLLLAAACSNKTVVEAVDIAAIDAEETYLEGSGTLEQVFSSLEELYKTADLVVDGTVSDGKTVMLAGFPQTHSVISVRSVLKGDPTLETVTIMEEGAVSSELGSAVIAVPPAEVGQHLLLFLVESQLPGFEENYYIAGAFQGKFIEREGFYFQQATVDTKLSENEYMPATLSELSERMESWK